MDRENVLRKISALKRVAARGSGATPSERETAGRLAAKLSDEHDVDDHGMEMIGDPRPDRDMSGVIFTWSFGTGGGTTTTFSY